MSRHLTHLTLATMCCLAASAAAVDPGNLDVRLSLGISPGLGELTTSGSERANGTPLPSNDETRTLSGGSGLTVEPGVFYTHMLKDNWGIVAGASFFYRAANTAFSGFGFNEALYHDAYGIDIACGPSWHQDVWRFEVTPVIGFGWSTVEVNFNSLGGADSASSENTTYFDYGIRAAGSYMFARHYMVGAQIGFMAFTTGDAKVTFKNYSEKDKLTGSGLLAAVTVGYAF